MEKVPESLDIYFCDQDIDIDKIVDAFFAEARNTPGITSLTDPDKQICKRKFKKILNSIFDLADNPRPSQIEIPISARDMRELTGYDWAKQKTIKLNIKYEKEALRDVFSSLDRKRLPRTVTKAEVLVFLKRISGLDALQEYEIELHGSDKEGELTVIIFNYGPVKVITLSGFKKKK